MLVRLFHDSMVALAKLCAVVCWDSGFTATCRTKLDKLIRKSSSVLCFFSRFSGRGGRKEEDGHTVGHYGKPLSTMFLHTTSATWTWCSMYALPASTHHAPCCNVMDRLRGFFAQSSTWNLACCGWPLSVLILHLFVAAAHTLAKAQY